MEQKQIYKTVLLTSIILGVISITIVYLMNIKLFFVAVQDHLFISILIIIPIRIAILSLMSYYLFKKWFAQENQYWSDIPFLLGITFVLVGFGKAIDILNNVTYSFFDVSSFLIILKLRYLLIATSVAPIIFLGLGIVLFWGSLHSKRIKDENINIIRKISILIMLVLEYIFIVLAPNIRTLVMILPILAIIPFLINGILFIFAYRQERLSEIHSLIFGVGLLIAVFTGLLRSILLALLNEGPLYVLIAEIADLIAYLVIFLGLSLKATYK